MVTIEDGIEIFNHQMEEPIRQIVEGSDEHLDWILGIIKPLKEGTEKLHALNESITKNINQVTDEYLKENILPKLRGVNKLCLILLGAIRTSSLYSSVRQSVRDFSSEHEVLREFIYDMQSIRLEKDDDFDNLLKDINAL